MHSRLRLPCIWWHQSRWFHCQWKHSQVFPLYLPRSRGGVKFHISHTDVNQIQYPYFMLYQRRFFLQSILMAKHMHCLLLESTDEDGNLQRFYEFFICTQANGLNDNCTILVDHTFMQIILYHFVSNLNNARNLCECEMQITWANHEYIFIVFIHLD